jgi:hypothetical protein
MRRFSPGLHAALMVAALLMVGLVATPAAQAALVFDGSPGSGAPPATLGGYTMVPSPQDARPDDVAVTDAPATRTSSFSFDTPALLRTIAAGATRGPAGGRAAPTRVASTLTRQVG